MSSNMRNLRHLEGAGPTFRRGLLCLMSAMASIVLAQNEQIGVGAHDTGCDALLALYSQGDRSSGSQTDLSRTIEIPLVEIAPEQLLEKVRKQVFAAIKTSGPQNDFSEVSFHVYHLKGGGVEVGSIFSSNREAVVLYSDILAVVDAEVMKLGAGNIDYVESYHTHPMVSPWL